MILNLFYFIFLNICIRYLIKNDHEPIFITLPSLRILKKQYSQKLSIKMKIRFWYRILFAPFSLFLWNIDDLLFDYKKQKINKPVFIIGGFRTGTTVIHRQILDKNKEFIAPRLFEILFPFLTIQYFLDFLEYLDNNYETKLIKTLDDIILWFCGEEVMKCHYMSYINAEEDDLLLSVYLGIGWYNIIQYPFPELSFMVGQIAKLTKEEQYHLQYFYHYFLQKCLFRRGENNKRILCKSHLVDFIPLLKKNYKKCSFIYTFRDTNEMKESWSDLQKKAIIQFHNKNYNLEEYNNDFWNLFYKDVEKYCKENVISIEMRIFREFSKQILENLKI